MNSTSVLFPGRLHISSCAPILRVFSHSLLALVVRAAPLFEGLRINAASIVADPQTKPSQIIRDFYFDMKAFGIGKSVSVGHSSAVIIRNRTSLSYCTFKILPKAGAKNEQNSRAHQTGRESVSTRANAFFFRLSVNSI